MMQQRKRFFSSSSDALCSTSNHTRSQDSLPLTSPTPVSASSSSTLTSPPSSGNASRLAPGRSHSSSATTALLRQRAGTGSPTTPKPTKSWRGLTSSNSFSSDLPYFHNSSSHGSSPYGHYAEDASYYYSKKRCWNNKVWLTTTVFGVLVVMCMYSYATNLSLQSTVELRDGELKRQQRYQRELETRVQMYRSQTHLLEDQLEGLAEENKHFQQEKEHLLQQHHEQRKALEEHASIQTISTEDIDKTRNQLFKMQHATAVMEHGIQAVDKRVVQEKYVSSHLIVIVIVYVYVRWNGFSPNPLRPLLLGLAYLQIWSRSVLLCRNASGLYREQR